MRRNSKTYHYLGSGVHRQRLMIKKSDCFQNTLRVIVTMKNIEIISHILFELILANCISKAKIGKINPILKFQIK